MNQRLILIDRIAGGIVRGLRVSSRPSRSKKVMPRRSRVEIAKWSSIVENQGRTGRTRLKRYLGSLILGRDFGESTEDYFERKGLTQFCAWAHKVLAERT